MLVVSLSGCKWLAQTHIVWLKHNFLKGVQYILMCTISTYRSRLIIQGIYIFNFLSPFIPKCPLKLASCYSLKYFYRIKSRSFDIRINVLSKDIIFFFFFCILGGFLKMLDALNFFVIFNYGFFLNVENLVYMFIYKYIWTASD